MIGLLPIGKIASAIAVGYAALMIYFLSGRSLNTLESILFVAKWFGILSLLLAVFFSVGWRILWRHVHKLNDWVFPDLEGTWDMTIHFTKYEDSGSKRAPSPGTKNATAEIKQSMLKLSMEVASEDSESKTIVAKPKKDPESGRPILFYAYEVEPHDNGVDDPTPYKGMALLTLGIGSSSKLSGNYFTDRRTKGRFTLVRRIENASAKK